MPAVSISLPVVEGAGYAHDRNLGETLKATIGVTLSEAQMHTVVKAAIVGPASGLVHDGRIVAAVKAKRDDDGRDLPYDNAQLLFALRQPKKDLGGDVAGGQRGQKTGGKAHGDWKDGSPEGLMAALTEKIAVITMMDIEEITPERDLDDYGLDSLISVELRNWIKRESGVDLSLSAIIESENLQALVDDILPKMEG